ncbi:MAG: hypothetical protein QGH90_02965 [Candidatus Poseidoniaceae archaeon]|jgi:hypothetical protein|nr:hypothetical protein [Candidatus Poseidoniaceae archaeon]MDP7000841.1 hypothetical protein [Candidatus Poseidoniaceae archaeon]
MSDLELVGPKEWQNFLAAPIAVLVLGKNGCVACEEWTEELQNYSPPENVRIGKILLDTKGLGRFKISHPWVSEVNVLPYNAIFVDGTKVKEWAGGGLTRLENRIARYK